MCMLVFYNKFSNFTHAFCSRSCGPTYIGEPSTVEPLHNGRPSDKVNWPLWTGGRCREVKMKINLSTGTKLCGRCRQYRRSLRGGGS